MKSRSLFAPLFVLPLALTMPPASAQDYSVTASAVAGPPLDQYSYGKPSDSHTGPTAVAANAGYHYFNDYKGASEPYPDTVDSTVSVTGQQGLLTAQNNASTFNNGSSNASAKGNWTDTLTVASSTLIAGTPVEILFLASYQTTIQVGVFTPLGGGINNASASVDFETRATDAATGTAAPLTFQKTYTGPYNDFPPVQTDSMTLQATLNTTVGATVNLSSLIDIETANGSTFESFKVRTFGNASVSSAVYINTPNDVSIISASGHNYTATPAPASLPIFAAGGGVLLFALRRHRVKTGRG